MYVAINETQNGSPNIVILLGSPSVATVEGTMVEGAMVEGTIVEGTMV